MDADEAEDPEALLTRHLPGLRAFVRLRMGPGLRAKESVSDLVQSTCREVLAHTDRYRHRGEGNFRRWLFVTASRKVKNRLSFYRAGKREMALDPGRDESLAALYRTFSTPSGHLMSKERIERVEAAFDRLSAPHREVILLSRLVGLPHAEVAETMGRSVQSTRSLLHRALAELAGLIDSPGDGG